MASLQSEIAHYVGQGFQVTSQTADSAALVKPKKFSLLAFFLMLGVFYLPFYAAKKPETVYLRLEGDRVKRSGGKWSLGRLAAEKMRS